MARIELKPHEIGMILEALRRTTPQRGATQDYVNLFARLLKLMGQ